MRLIASLIFISLFFVNFANAADERPNILVILADDLGYGDLGFTGSKDIFTPNIDQLANNGVEITNGYVTHPFCGPSRAGLITGRYQARFGMEINITNSPFDQYNGLPLSETTFATRLQKSGYETGIIGKWHLGGSPAFHPNNRGFDYFYGFLAGGHSYFPHQVNTRVLLTTKKGTPNYSANEGTDLPLERNNKAAEFNEYLTTALSRDAVNFVSKADKPFMLYLAYNAPHQPLEAPKTTIAKYKHIANKERRVYAAMIDEMDAGIGMVVNALKKSGKLDNTLIFFLSDNGGAASYKGHNKYAKTAFSDSGPYRDGKGSMREGGSHVPFIAHWPKQLKAGKYHGLVSALDIAATSVAIGKGDNSGYAMDGKNMMPYLTGEQKGSVHQALYWRTEHGRWAVRDLKTKYLLQDLAQPELYNMTIDPYETTNLVETATTERKAMAALWNKWNQGNINNHYLPAGLYQKARLNFYKELSEQQKEKAQKQQPLVIQ
ncbi:MAG: sulfatase family protein [Thalassotalea sp.]